MALPLNTMEFCACIVEYVPAHFAWTAYPWADYGKQFSTYVRPRTEPAELEGENGLSCAAARRKEAVTT